MKFLYFYLSDFVVGVAETGEEFQDWDESSGCRCGKKTESVFDEAHKARESRIVVRKTDAHQQGADNIAYGRRQVRTEFNGSSALTGHVLQ